RHPDDFGRRADRVVLWRDAHDGEVGPAECDLLADDRRIAVEASAPQSLGKYGDGCCALPLVVGGVVSTEDRRQELGVPDAAGRGCRRNWRRVASPSQGPRRETPEGSDRGERVRALTPARVVPERDGIHVLAGTLADRDDAIAVRERQWFEHHAVNNTK